MNELEQLRRELDDQVAARVEAGLCGCGCGTAITSGGNGRRKYVDQAHRQRRYRYALRRLAEVEGISTRVSLRLVTEAHAAHDRNGDAQTARRKPRKARKPDLRISYRKAINALGHYPGAEAKLRELLPPAARKAAA